MKARSLAVPLIVLATFATSCASQDASGGAGEGDQELAQGVTDDEILLGTSLGLTGTVSVAAEGARAGLEAAVKEINDAGGINGRSLSLEVLDDGYEAPRSVANIRRLAEETQVFAIVSPFGSGLLPASWPFVEGSGIPVVGPVLPADPDLENVYILGTGHSDQARVLVDYMADENVHSVGVFAQDNDLGHLVQSGVEDQAPVHDIKILPAQTVEPLSTDVRAAVLNMRDAAPDAVVFGTDNTQTGLILQEAKALGWEPKWFGTSTTMSTGGPGVVKAAGEAALGVYGSTASLLPNADTPEIDAYRAAVTKVNAEQAGSNYAVTAYATMKVFAEMLEKAGKSPTWDSFNVAAEKMDGFETGLLPPVTFGPMPGGRTGTTGAMVAQWDGTKWAVLSEDWLQPQ